MRAATLRSWESGAGAGRSLPEAGDKVAKNHVRTSYQLEQVLTPSVPQFPGNSARPVTCCVGYVCTDV